MQDELLIGRAGVRCPFVALQQHLGKARAAAEVAVNLKRWAVVEQVGQRAAPQQGPILLARRITVLQPGEETDHPGAAPTCSASAVGQSMVENLARSGKQLRRRRGDQIERVQADEMRHVAMPRLSFLIGLVPFQKAAVRPELPGWEFVKRRCYARRRASSVSRIMAARSVASKTARTMLMWYVEAVVMRMRFPVLGSR